MYSYGEILYYYMVCFFFSLECPFNVTYRHTDTQTHVALLLYIYDFNALLSVNRNYTIGMNIIDMKRAAAQHNTIWL